MRRSVWPLCLAIFLPACTTIQAPNYPYPDVENPGVIILAEPVIDPAPAPEPAAPPPPPDEQPDEPTYEAPNRFADLPGWADADHRPALQAFRRTCTVLAKGKLTDFLNPNQPQYGRYADWVEPCETAKGAIDTPLGALAFFEDQFVPLTFSAATEGEGMLTGYYEPEVDVRVAPDEIYYEPVLAVPKNQAARKLPRSKLGPQSSRVIAYGKPIDIFFLQIQGSGRLRFEDGRVLRAAYAGNNGKTYKSIGRVLIERGELTRDQSAKRDIEAWMARNGREASRALMNENPRYIFFAEQKIEPGEGPRGAGRVPLTGMGSIAVDPRYHPYGTLAWLETTLPTEPRDYTGEPARLLVVAQDTGNAIRGPLRGDLFFGSGSYAGALAGVMKHPVRWTVLVPKALAPEEIGAS